jgi:hypothetical protein
MPTIQGIFQRSGADGRQLVVLAIHSPPHASPATKAACAGVIP